MEEKEFVFEKTVYLTDTNLFGNAYFARYFDWQGMAREEFFHRVAGEDDSFFRSGIKFVTIEASIKYHYEVTLFDVVIIKAKPANIQKVTFELVFTYINKKTGQLIAEGRQKIGFVDSNNKVIAIPDGLRDSWGKYQQS
jgi:YbgC/YbaW family acyl-CoA thioester hydrolase